MKLPLISAGELFELLRPAAFVLSALLSIWVLVSTRRLGFRLYIGFLWALGTFFLPFVVLPIYVIVWRRLQRRAESPAENSSVVNAKSQITERVVPAEAQSRQGQRRLVAPAAAYGLLLLGATGVYLYRDYNSVDAHLARATQAKLSSQPAQTILEYRAALALEDDPHTHKLLGIELAEAGQWAVALNEFRLAERGGEPDDSLPYRIAQALDAGSEPGEAVAEYRRFLASRACAQELPDERCEAARKSALKNAR